MGRRTYAALAGAWALTLMVAGCNRSSTSSDTPAKPTEADKGSVPTKLFEVQLGKIYRAPDGLFTSSDIPMAKFAGVQQGFMGHGIHFYFQPRKVYEAFPYVEERKTPEDKYFGTSYRLYMLPVIPKGATSIKEVEEQKTPSYEVQVIEWRKSREGGDRNNEDYYWASSMCKTFEADLGVKPKVSEAWSPPSAGKTSALDSYYTCTFSEGSRELEVSSLFGRKVSLGFKNEVTKAKDEAFETAIRKLQAPAIRPY